MQHDLMEESPSTGDKPLFKFLSSPEHRLQVADIHLYHGDLGTAVRGQQGSTDGFGFAHVPARQTQVQPIVYRQQPLAEGQANATEKTIQTQGTR